MEHLLHQGFRCYLPTFPSEKLRQGALTVMGEPERFFKSGGRLTETSIAGINGVYQMNDGERPVVVLVELLSRQVRVVPGNLHGVD